MPDFSTFNSVGNIQPPTEFSVLRSPRDKDSLYTLWQYVRDCTQRCNKLSQVVNQQARDIKKLESRRTMDLNLFPFAIYNVPIDLRPPYNEGQYTSSLNWTTFRVRGGYVFQNFMTTASLVEGTDGIGNYANYNFLPPVGNYDIQVPSGSYQYFFWVETSPSSSYTASSYNLRYSANPPVQDSIGNPNGWIGWPSSSANYWMLGWVDNATSGSINMAFVHQVQYGDIVVAPNVTIGICTTGQTYTIPGWISSSLF